MTGANRYDNWEIVDTLPKGGQGQVYVVRDISGYAIVDQRVSRLRNYINDLFQSNSIKATQKQKDFISEIRRISEEVNSARLGALKKLHPIDDKSVPDKNKAMERMRNELDALKAVSHDALVKVLDEKFTEQWFVMEFHPNGTLSQSSKNYNGRVLESLTAIRPIADAVSELHNGGFVHRDIKPDNIFVSSEESLVLGDCGLACTMARVDRLTETYENVGTRDFQPAWSHGMRIDEINPRFDVVTLGKTLWSMISGIPTPSLWYGYKETDDIRELTTDHSAELVHQLLRKCVTSHERDMEIEDAHEFVEEVDCAIEAISPKRRVPNALRSITCQVCGSGTYKKAEKISDNKNYTKVFEQTSVFTVQSFICDTCGHLHSFAWKSDGEKPVWLQIGDII